MRARTPSISVMTISMVVIALLWGASCSKKPRAAGSKLRTVTRETTRIDAGVSPAPEARSDGDAPPKAGDTSCLPLTAACSGGWFWPVETIYDVDIPECWIFATEMLEAHGVTYFYAFVGWDRGNRRCGKLVEIPEGGKAKVLHSFNGVSYDEGEFKDLRNVNGRIVCDYGSTRLEIDPGSSQPPVPEKAAHADATPFSPIERLPSHDGSLVAVHEQNRLTIKKVATGDETVVIDQEYTGSWSIGKVSWSPNDDALYFDNDGAVACIWEYTFATKELRKVVAEHDAAAPLVYDRQGRRAIFYKEANGKEIHRLMLAHRPPLDIRAMGRSRLARMALGNLGRAPYCGRYFDYGAADGGYYTLAHHLFPVIPFAAFSTIAEAPVFIGGPHTS